MDERQKTWLLGGITGFLVLFLICTCCVCAGFAFLALAAAPTPTPTPYVPPATPSLDQPTPIPLVTPVSPATPSTSENPTPVAPLPDEAAETLDAIQQAVIPGSDLHELGIRFLGVDPDTPRVLNQTNPDYEVGTHRIFHTADVDEDRQFDITAVLIYKTEHIYMWVEQGVNINENKLREAADLFEEHTYPTNREFFGSEWTPGVDNDPHISILHARNIGSTVAGYFSSSDSYVKAVREDSNEMEMVYISLDNNIIGDDFYNGVIAHEFQHMIHWYNDANEDTWLNEGCSELAMELNNRNYPGGHYDVGGSEYSYLRHPDTQLTTWSEGAAGDNSAHYGGAYLFVSYFLDRFGEQATRDLVAQDQNGMESVDKVLQDLDMPFTHKEVFADWIVANLLDTPDVGGGRYNYPSINLDSVRIGETYRRASDYPVTQETTVEQYGVDYIEVNSSNPLRFSFTGEQQSQLMDTQAHSGQYLWWSNRSDESDARLTLRLDLNEANSVEASFWTWYHIEEDWDYAYVVVGTTDSGTLPADLSEPHIHWTILDDRSLNCTNSNPNNNNFGCGLTGNQDWQKRNIDLSDYAGQEIALRFEYITDAAVNQAGFALDDVTITADGQTIFADDIESHNDTWEAEGFVRHANVLPQEWIVQLVSYGSQTQVDTLILADATSGEWVIPFNNRMDKATIVISALAPVTTEAATYEFSLMVEE